MVIVIFFSGRSNPKPHTSTTPMTQPTALPPSEDKLNDYRKRIEEESQKLAQEQAELVRSKGAFERTANQQRFAPDSGGPGANSYAPRSESAQSAQEPSQISLIAQENAKREYASRFESNIALSYRTDSKPAGTDAAIPRAQALPPLDPRLYPWPFVAPPGTQSPPPANDGSVDNVKPIDQTKQLAKSTLPDLNHSTGKDYRLFEGTIIETVLTNRLDGTFSGPVNCLVSYDVYSHDHDHILIPSGSRVLGDVHPVDSSGQSRLAVTFHRLVMPDGFTVNLDQFRGLDQVGETGLRDQVNHHYATNLWRIDRDRTDRRARSKQHKLWHFGIRDRRLPARRREQPVSIFNPHPGQFPEHSADVSRFGKGNESRSISKRTWSCRPTRITRCRTTSRQTEQRRKHHEIKASDSDWTSWGVYVGVCFTGTSDSGARRRGV